MEYRAHVQRFGLELWFNVKRHWSVSFKRLLWRVKKCRRGAWERQTKWEYCESALYSCHYHYMSSINCSLCTLKTALLQLEIWTVSELLKICRWKDPFRMKNWWEDYFCCEIIWYCGVLTFTHRISRQILNLLSENKDNFLTSQTSTGNLSSYSTIYADEYSFQTPTASVCKENKCVSDTISWTQTGC